MTASAVEELHAAFDEPFRTLGTHAARDRDAVVISWPTLPIELVHAAGFSPIIARGDDAPTPAADRVLEPDLFPNRLRQLVEAALTGRLNDVAAVIVPRSSDPDYKCFLYLRELVRRGAATALPPILLFDLLHSPGADATTYNVDRTRALAAQLAHRAGRAIEPHDLRRTIESCNRARAAARRLDAERTGTPRIAGSDGFASLGAFWQLPPERYAVLANAAADSAARRAPQQGPRTLLAGVPVDGTALHEAVEAEGGVVVAEVSPFGSSGTACDVESSEDPFASLAEHCRRESLDARLPLTALLRKLGELLDGVEAVVVSLPTYDASFGWDYPRIRELLAARSIPHLVLDGDPNCSPTPAERTRLRTLLGDASSRREASYG
jgi:benzoyl-CoA reductase/2-hydroxyglutaryl-CoA dehydratase subunit BcrC/BadD/HgdB